MSAKNNKPLTAKEIRAVVSKLNNLIDEDSFLESDEDNEILVH